VSAESEAPLDAAIKRRTLLSRLAIGLGSFLAAAIGLPIGGAVFAAAFRREEPSWVDLGRLSEFPTGQPRMVTFGTTRVDGYLKTTASRAVWVYRESGEEVRVYNARCTHLGCLVSYQGDSQTFLSPCHAGIFALRDGAVLDGPPPRPLDRLEYRLDGGNLAVRYRDFVVGVPNQVPL
jgi:Rieske Fe-S protein